MSLEKRTADESISILVVCGVRPQFIKCAAFQKRIIAYNRNSKRKIIATYFNSGQHYDDELAGAFIRQLKIDFTHTIVHKNLNPGHIFGKIISEISDFISEQIKKPEWVIIFGDANTTLAAAIAANKAGCKIAHFEAGTAVKNLKTPEVINGILLSHLVDVQFCSTELAADSLNHQGITKNIFIVGDVAREYVIEYANKLESGLMDSKNYVLVTIHHEENLVTKENIEILIKELGNYSKVFFIAHPRTKKKLTEWGIYIPTNMEVIDSLSYSEMLSAIKGCRFIVTDSGGLQREAYYLKKRCLIYSNVDFWPDLQIADVHRQITPNHWGISDGLKWVEEKIRNEDFPSVQCMDKSDVVSTAIKILFSISDEYHG